MTNKLLLIDGNSIAFKAFYALYTAMDKFTNPSGLHTSAIYGFNPALSVWWFETCLLRAAWSTCS